MARVESGIEGHKGAPNGVVSTHFQVSKHGRTDANIGILPADNTDRYIPRCDLWSVSEKCFVLLEREG